MDLKNMKLSVNILTWQNWDVLHRTLHSLPEDLKGIEWELVVVDNGSTDGCQDAATIKNGKNLGISVGKNQGIKASKGEYIFLLDGDIFPVPNSIRCLLEYMEAHPDIEALGFHANKWTNQDSKEKDHYEKYCKEIVQVEENNAHCCYYGMYRRSVFDKGAYFDEWYGAGYGYEDLDFFMEMKKRGIKQYHCHINSPSGKYFHKINSSIRVMGHPEYMRTCKARSLYYENKWKVGQPCSTE